MKPALLLATAAFIAAPWIQRDSTVPVEMDKEPHHVLRLQNPSVRVFQIRLLPNEVTLLHRHATFYAFLSLQKVTISNEVPGRSPVLTPLDGGELHTSKGGFNVAERNNSAEPADLLVIEATKPAGNAFVVPMGGFRLHDAAFASLFESPAVRGYSMTVGATGKVERHEENYDRLVVALSDLKLHEDIAGQPSSELEMKAGEVRWFPHGWAHATTNTGKTAATFITLEFN